MDRYNPVEAVSWGARAPLALLRVVSGLLFLEHGTQKLLRFPHGGAFAPVGTLTWWAGVMEVVGGFLLVLGLFSRPVGFILAGEMACAYWMVHAPRSVFPIQNGGDPAILFCFVFLYIGAIGGGAFSLDSAIAKRTGHAVPPVDEKAPIHGRLY